MINSAASASRNFTDTAVLKQRFQKAAGEITQRQAVVERLESMAEDFLSLDGSKYDQDDAPGSVAIGDDNGLMAFVEARPTGGVLSMEVLDERGPEVKEYTIEPDLKGVSYSVSVGGVEQTVYEDGNGLLALFAEIAELLPSDGDSPEASKR